MVKTQIAQKLGRSPSSAGVYDSSCQRRPTINPLNWYFSILAEEWRKSRIPRVSDIRYRRRSG